MGKINDINVDINGTNLVCRACAVVINDGKVLFQKRAGDKYWALPGGKIEVNETTKESLTRELKEELAIENFEVGKVIAVTENFFKLNDNKIHQYIFTHEVKFIDTKYNNMLEFEGAEVGKNVIFTWIKINELKTSLIKPDYVVDQILSMDGNIKFDTCIED